VAANIVRQHANKLFQMHPLLFNGFDVQLKANYMRRLLRILVDAGLVSYVAMVRSVFVLFAVNSSGFAVEMM
jgi:hypothetical protein